MSLYLRLTSALLSPTLSGEVRSHVQEAAGQFVRWGPEASSPAAAAAAGSRPPVPSGPRQPEPGRGGAAVPPLRPLLHRPHGAARWTGGLHGAELPRWTISVIQGLCFYKRTLKINWLWLSSCIICSSDRPTPEEKEAVPSTWTSSRLRTNQDWILTASNRSRCATTGPASSRTAPSATETRRPPRRPWPNSVRWRNQEKEPIFNWIH